mgnify:CR=1 FL=1
MFTKKNKYFLLIENIKDIDFKNIKIRNKFSIIYRNNKKNDKLEDLLKDSFLKSPLVYNSENTLAIQFFSTREITLFTTLKAHQDVSKGRK